MMSLTSTDEVELAGEFQASMSGVEGWGRLKLPVFLGGIMWFIMVSIIISMGLVVKS